MELAEFGQRDQGGRQGGGHVPEHSGTLQQERNMADQPPTTFTIIRRKTVESLTGLSRSTIYARIKEGRFPPSISLGAKAVGWLRSDIETWIAQRVQESRGTPDGTP
jgi:prophage regulatory protein